MKKVFYIVMLIILTVGLYGDESLSRHSLSLSLGGPRSLAYFEYQNDLITKNSFTISISGGLGMSRQNTTASIGINLSLGETYQLLFGFHGIPAYHYNSNCKIELSPRVGIRTHFNLGEDDYFFQLYLSPYLQQDQNSFIGRYIDYIGIGFGVYL